MILTCFDCPDPKCPSAAKQWRYPCPDCAEPFLASHRAQGHNIQSRAERPGDRYVFGVF